MKKLILSAAIILGGLTAVTAQTEKKSLSTSTEKQSLRTSTENSQTPIKQASKLRSLQDYKEVRVSEVPQTVRESVAKNHSDASLSKAYVNAKGEYKFKLTTADRKESVIHTDANGKLVKKELKKQ